MNVRWGMLCAIAIIAIGASAQFAATSTSAEFSDAHVGSGNVTADPNYSQGGGGGPFAPVADAGGPYTVQEGGSVRIDGSDSTNAFVYQWSIVSGPGGGYYYPNNGTGQYNASFDTQGTTTVILELTVTDMFGRSDTDRVAVTVTDTNGTASTNAISTASNPETVATTNSEPVVPPGANVTIPPKSDPVNETRVPLTNESVS